MDVLWKTGFGWIFPDTGSELLVRFELSQRTLHLLFINSSPAVGLPNDTQTAVSEQYTDYPYPAYEKREEIGDKDAFLIQTDCSKAKCHSIARNTTWLNYYMFTIALGPLNHYLYKVVLTYFISVLLQFLF